MDAMNACIDKRLENQDALRELGTEVRDFACSHGIVLRTVEEPHSSERVIHAPFSLLPSPVPSRCFRHACDVQTHLNLLMHRVAHNRAFLHECLKNTIKVDDFTRHMWDIYATVEQEGVAQPVSLAMNRSDYMLDCEGSSTNGVDWGTVSMKQIEFNTMASSMAGLGQQLTLYHRFILNEIGHQDKVACVPDNTATDGLACGVVEAWRRYGQPNAVVMFLVYDVDRNIYDQRRLEYAIKKQDPKIKVIRRSLKDLQERGSLAEDKTLVIDGCEVAIVYQRSCYTPDDFKSEKDWDTRLMFERSTAIKCPSVHYFLAGTKKVQQELARPGCLEKFIEDPEIVALIRSTFTGLYSLDKTTEGDAAIDRALANPDRYVLKPQREGGGNNTFGNDIPPFLEKIRHTDDRMAYILMDRIFPAPSSNYAVRAGQEITKVDLVSEIGIFGTLVGTVTEVFHNSQDGYLVRSKTLGTDEGGVATGFAVLDSPCLM